MLFFLKEYIFIKILVLRKSHLAELHCNVRINCLLKQFDSIALWKKKEILNFCTNMFVATLPEKVVRWNIGNNTEESIHKNRSPRRQAIYGVTGDFRGIPFHSFFHFFFFCTTPLVKTNHYRIISPSLRYSIKTSQNKGSTRLSKIYSSCSKQ